MEQVWVDLPWGPQRGTAATRMPTYPRAAGQAVPDSATSSLLGSAGADTFRPAAFINTGCSVRGQGSPERQRMAVGLPGWLLKASEVVFWWFSVSTAAFTPPGLLVASSGLCYSLTKAARSGQGAPRLCSLSKVPTLQEQQGSQAQQKKDKTSSALDHTPLPDLGNSPSLPSMRQ